MPKQPRSLPAALRRRPVLGLIAILLVLVIAYVVSDTKGSGGSQSPPATTSLGLGVPSTGTATPTSTTSGSTSADVDPESGLRYVNQSALPAEATKTLALIASTGPFPYSQDGGTFQNRERLLPAHPGGYYTEYTVPTPGEDDRGPRRIIAGAAGQRYYTSDHYSSFERIRLGK